MALQTINIGQFVNDGTGDDLRTAFSKINANFEEIDLLAGQNNTISNIGTGFGLYKEKIGVDLRLKSLKAGPGITLTNNATDITITNNRNMIVTVNANTGSLTASSATQAINIVGGSGITTAISGSTLTINGSTYTISTDTNPTLGGDLDLNGFNIIGGPGTNIVAENFNGNLIGLVNGINPLNLFSLLDFDFGFIDKDPLNPIMYFLATLPIDMGTITAPVPFGIDGGTFV